MRIRYVLLMLAFAAAVAMIAPRLGVSTDDTSKWTIASATVYPMWCLLNAMIDGIELPHT